MLRNSVRSQTQGAKSSIIKVFKDILEQIGLSLIRPAITNKTLGQQHSEPRVKCLFRIVALFERFKTIKRPFRTVRENLKEISPYCCCS